MVIATALGADASGGVDRARAGDLFQRHDYAYCAGAGWLPWLGTEFGLLRFDGVRFTPWQPPAAEHLPSEYVAAVLAARDGTLWIGTRDGLASWKNGRLTIYPKMAGQIVFRLLEEHNGIIWAGGIRISNEAKPSDTPTHRLALLSS